MTDNNIYVRAAHNFDRFWANASPNERNAAIENLVFERKIAYLTDQEEWRCVSDDRVAGPPPQYTISLDAAWPVIQWANRADGIEISRAIRELTFEIGDNTASDYARLICEIALRHAMAEKKKATHDPVD